MEIMIVVVIIGLLAAMAIPAFQKVREKSQVTAIVNDIRQFTAAFEVYALEKGGWPPDVTTAGVEPEGMNSGFPAAAWAKLLPGGHAWDWDVDVLGVKAAISIRVEGGNNADPLFVAIDKAIDDGNIHTGKFRLNGDRFMIVMQE